MSNNLLFLFGLPGVGKSYVAEILHSHYGYSLYNGDDALPEDMKIALFQKKLITDTMRESFTNNMIVYIRSLKNTTQKLAIHQTLIKEFMREQLRNAFPDATFILIQSDAGIRENRYIKRKYFNLGLPYLRHMSNLFDPPKIPHMVFDNSKNGKQYILEAMKQLL